MTNFKAGETWGSEGRLQAVTTSATKTNSHTSRWRISSSYWPEHGTNSPKVVTSVCRDHVTSSYLATLLTQPRVQSIATDKIFFVTLFSALARLLLQILSRFLSTDNLTSWRRPVYLRSSSISDLTDLTVSRASLAREAGVYLAWRDR